VTTQNVSIALYKKQPTRHVDDETCKNKILKIQAKTQKYKQNIKNIPKENKTKTKTKQNSLLQCFSR